MVEGDKYQVPLRGGEWKLMFSRMDLGTDCFGVCLHDDCRIIINPELKGAQLVDTLIHEALQACIPDLREEVIEETSTHVLNLLIGLGFLKGPYCK